MASAVTIRGFDYMTKRLMPTRENLRRVHRGAAMSEEDIAGVELMLYLIRAADVVRESVYSGLRERELSEGKFALLMTLFEADGPVPVVGLAKRIGVSAPTTSVMVTRMLQAENPLIAKVQSKADARCWLIELTDEGRALITAELPAHTARVADFAKCLSGDECEQMIDMLKKLVADD